MGNTRGHEAAKGSCIGCSFVFQRAWVLIVNKRRLGLCLEGSL